MIISRTPYRISFFGGGTDYPAWYRQEGGAVLSTTIDKYCHISCRFLPPFFHVKHRIVWSHIETVNNISEILHPVVREGLRYLGFDDSVGLEIHHQGDLPARSGIGSSSSFSVGLIKALMALRGQMLGKQELALRAIDLEQNILKENVGSQDQVAAAYGGLNVIRFLPNDSVQVEPLIIPRERVAALETRLLMVYTGASRMGGEIAKRVIMNVAAKAALLRQLRGMVDRAAAILTGDGGLDEFGHLLHETWMIKREIASGITNDAVERIYRTAIEHGAIGGKLLGAGAAGFMLFYIAPGKHEEVARALSPYLQIPVAFENEGCTIIHYSSESKPPA